MTLLELFQLLKKHLKLVIALPVVCAIAMGVVSFTMMDNTYTATTSMYVLAKTDDSGQMSYNDLSASQMLSNDIATLLDSDSDSVKGGAAKDLGLADLDDYKISVSSETTTRVITLSVTGTDAEKTAEVARAMASSVSTVAQNVGAAQSINVIDKAKTPESPSGPKRTLYVAVAFLAGVFIAIAYVVLADMLNTRIRGVEEAEELLGIPVVGRIPAMKGGK
ncbi:putative capsular polysaccharide biosynthesis protein YwqC [Collinsella aerofaciens]|nr:putative capsular polysaccharide biosynthesis protein YwqC [Collinsella aerofaciens]